MKKKQKEESSLHMFSRLNGAGIILVLTKPKRVLLVKGKKSQKWSFPKGQQNNPKESLRACAIREMYEETGIRMRNLHSHPAMVFSGASDSKRCYFPCTIKDVHFASLFNLIEPKACDTVEIDDIRWFSHRELRSLRRTDVNIDVWRWINPTARTRFVPKSILDGKEEEEESQRKTMEVSSPSEVLYPPEEPTIIRIKKKKKKTTISNRDGKDTDTLSSTTSFSALAQDEGTKLQSPEPCERLLWQEHPPEKPEASKD